MYVNANDEGSEGIAVLDTETGERISGVVEADTDEGWIRLIPHGQEFRRPKGFRLVRIADDEELARTREGLPEVEVWVAFDCNGGGEEVWAMQFRVTDAATGETIPKVTAADTRAGTVTVVEEEVNEYGVLWPVESEDGGFLTRTYHDRPFHIVATQPESLRGYVIAESAHCKAAA